MRSASEYPWNQQNRARIGFAVFPLSAPPGAALRVHAQSQIARTRADFGRFSETSENSKTVWWSRLDLNLPPRGRLCFGKLSATLAQYLAEDNIGNAGENLIAGNSPLISEPPCAFSSCLGTGTFGHPAADFGPAGLASEAKQSNVYELSAQEAGQPMKSKISVHYRATLASEIAALAEATSADLKSRWRVLYSTEPPSRISRDLLTRAVAYRIQEEALGGLKPSTRRSLAKVAADASARRPIQVTPAPTLTPGTVLLRDWRGTQHQVIVREHGVEFQGKRYKSLSQVAHRITGNKWSGPLFFGLKAKPQEHADGSV